MPSSGNAALTARKCSWITQPEKTNSWNIPMIPQLAHPLLPLKMVLVGLPWVEVLIRLVLDALFAVDE